MTARVDILAEFSARWDYNPGIRFFSTAQKEAWLDDALAEFSRYRPRRGLVATVNIVAAQAYVVLPDDYLTATNDQLCDVLYGTQLTSFTSSYIVQTSNFKSFNRWGTNHTYPVVPRPKLQVVRQTVESSVKYVLLIPQSDIPGASREESLVYDGIHLVTDSPDLNTLDPEGTRRIHLFMKGYALDQLQKQYTVSDPKMAAQYGQQAKAALAEARARLNYIVS